MLFEMMIEDICTAKSPSEAAKIFNMCASALKGWRFIVSTPKGTMPGHSVNRKLSEKVHVHSLFSDDQVFFLDERVAADPKKGRVIFYDYSIMLDTMAVSYIEPYLINKKRLREQEDHVKTMLLFLADPKVQCDPIPYLLENTPRLKADRNGETIFNRLKAYNVLRSLDLEKLEKSSEISSVLSELELAQETNVSISEHIRRFQESDFKDEVEQNYFIFYIVFLKMVEIQRSSKRESRNKFIEFMDFSHDVLNALLHRPILIAKEYFNSPNLSFFAFASGAGKNFFAQARGAAWDMLHVYNAERALGLLPNQATQFFIPAFLTFDQKLSKLIEIAPLYSCAISPDGQVSSFYAGGSFPKKVSEGMKDPNAFLIKYFGEDAVYERASRRETTPIDHKKIAYELEKSVARILNITPPDEEFHLF